MGPGHRADDIEGVGDVGHPVAHRLVEGVLEGLGARFDRHHLGPEQLHPIDVGGLSADVLRTHVDDALHAVARSHGGGRDAVLTGAGLGDDAGLAHPSREHRLADAVIHLVSAGVIEVFALQVDLSTAQFAGPALGVIDRTGPPDIVLEFVFELGLKCRIPAAGLVGLLQFLERRNQRLGDEDAAVGAEMALLVRQRVGGISHLHCELPLRNSGSSRRP